MNVKESSAESVSPMNKPTELKHKGMTTSNYIRSTRKEKKEPSSRARLWASYASTIIGVTATAPFDVLKTRLQIQMDREITEKVYTRIHHSFQRIWQEEGIRGLFKGYRATLVCTPVFHSIYFPIYERLRLTFSELLGAEKEDFKVVFASWGISGFVSNMITNPMWLIRTRMQGEIFKSQGKPNYQRKYRSIAGSIYRVYSKEGFLALYTGLTASLINISHVLVYFPVYEKTKLFFRVNFESDRETLSAKYVSLSVLISKWLASTVSYPIELIRARQQDSIVSEGRDSKFLGVLKRTYANEGAMAFYSGFSLNLMRILPQNIIIFMLYEKLSDLFTNSIDL